MQDYDFTGGAAVVTGAASGIGEALAHALAELGSRLVLIDRDEEKLAAVATAVRGRHPALAVATYVVDLADGAATQAVAERLVAEHPDVTLLVNNAGVALGGRFDQVSAEEFDWLMAVNFSAVVRLTRALLPVLKSHPGAHLANVSSLFGLIAPAGQVAYASSKFAVRGFTEALRHELVADGVGVTSIHPGGIRTSIAANARVGSGVPADEGESGKKDFEKFLTMDPAKAAALVVTAIERRRPRLLIGASAVIPDVLARLAPGSYGRLLQAGTALAARSRR
jgi:short-subunit dehydrogenase